MATLRRLRTAHLSVAAGLFLLPLGASSQAASLDGIVLSSAGGARAPGVLLVVDSGERAKTGADGAYVLERISAGTHRVALVAPGCQITFATVQVEAGEHRTLGFEITYDPRLAEDAVRKRRSSGTVFTAREIEAMHAHALTDVLSRVAPGFVGASPPQPGQDARLRSRGVVSARSAVAPAVILDGVRMGELEVGQLSDIPLSDVAWIEVLRGASGGWEVGTGGSGGLVRIQTKRGRPMDMPYVEPERCEIPGWGG